MGVVNISGKYTGDTPLLIQGDIDNKIQASLTGYIQGFFMEEIPFDNSFAVLIICHAVSTVQYLECFESRYTGNDRLSPS